MDAQSGLAHAIEGADLGGGSASFMPIFSAFVRSTLLTAGPFSQIAALHDEAVQRKSRELPRTCTCPAKAFAWRREREGSTGLARPWVSMAFGGFVEGVL
jgi:hypothetical protein